MRAAEQIIMVGGSDALGGVPYTPEALARFAALTPAPSAAYKSTADALYIALKNAGLLPRLDSLQIYDGPVEQYLTVDWIDPSRRATFVSSPTVVLDGYVETDGVASYIDTGFNPSTMAVHSTKDSSVFGISTVDSTQGTTSSWAGWVDPGFGGDSILGRSSTDTFAFRVNQTGAASSGANTDGSGLIAANRSGASATQFYLRGVAQTVTTNANVTSGATALPFNNNIFLGHITAASFSSRKFNAFVYGASLDAADHAALNAILASFFLT